MRNFHRGLRESTCSCLVNMSDLNVGFRDKLVDHKCLCKAVGSGLTIEADFSVMGLFKLVARLDCVRRLAKYIYLIILLP